MHDDFDPSGMTALVVDDNHYERGISLDQLRGMGFGRAMGAASTSEAWDLLLKINPDVVMVEWIDSVNSGLDFVRRVRHHPEAPNRAASIFMLTARGYAREVENARKAGADGFLRKPISAIELKRRVRVVVTNPQPFVVSDQYVGPCRRRRQDPEAPLRRNGDVAPEIAAAADPAGLDDNAQLARARLIGLESALREYLPGDSPSLRAVFAATQELYDVAERIEDDDLVFGVKELLRYLRASASVRADPEVLHTHVGALHQLVHLPRAVGAERKRVARGLKRMIDKKLRKAAHAA